MNLTTLDSAFEQVSELVARFKANEARYLSPDYQEAEIRAGFSNKVFNALGWDVNHDTQTNPYEQEVKAEKADGGSKRRADYAFYATPGNTHGKSFDPGGIADLSSSGIPSGTQFFFLSRAHGDGCKRKNHVPFFTLFVVPMGLLSAGADSFGWASLESCFKNSWAFLFSKSRTT